MKPWYSLLVSLFLSSSIALPAKAQITTDGTTNTNLNPIFNGIRIDDGDRAGNNLFHSFEQFSVLNGSEAFFNNANDIVNIFSRVTGGNISTIDGLLRANGTANLFLLNPAGIIFGENAQLDIGGSFLSSTADSIVFSDGVKFLATDSDEPPLLTINMPIGLNLGNNPGQIVNRSYNGNGLEVATGESITLVGGNINLEGGKLFAPGGRVELGGLSTAGEVGINGDGSLVFPEGVARADVTFTNGARVDVRAGDEGNIGVNARNLELSGGELGASFLLAGIAENSGSNAAQAGDITLNATDTITVSQDSGIFSQVVGEGDSGGINITTTNLSLREGGQIDATTFGAGNAGAIDITTTGTISAEGGGIFSQVVGEGDSGGINITTTNLSLREGGQIDATTFGAGNTGAIDINATGTISAEGGGIFSQVVGEGDSGGINITTTNLSLREGGQIDATTFGAGNTGAIDINATGTLSVGGKDLNGSSSGIFSQVSVFGEGNSGGIDITTVNLSLSEGGEITANTSGTGNAGAININVLNINSIAQITSDGTTETTLTPIGYGVRIDNGDREGNNLFHSFEQFSIFNGSEVFFNNAPDIVNIFSRVTGGDISNIDGLIRANGTANLFLLNPAGIIFGENASLDIGGSLLGSTADSIIFNDSVEFSATDADNPPSITTNMPIGLNLGNNPGDIVNRAGANNTNGLELATGENLTLVGGNINLEGSYILAREGRVELGGLSAAGKVGINDDGSLSFPEGIARADVQLSDLAIVNVASEGEGGGSIAINAKDINLTGRSLLVAGLLRNRDFPDAQAGDITLNATGNITATQESDISNQIALSGVGNAGQINITTANLFLREGSRVVATARSEGNAGDITINATGTISIEGESSVFVFTSGIFSQVGSKGNAGEITINTANLSLKGGQVNTINFGEGDSGEITINTANLSLKDGGRVDASTLGQGNAGEITINATGTIFAEGATLTNNTINSGIFSVVADSGEGKSGVINITTTDLFLKGGAVVNAATFGNGNAGQIIINAAGTISAEGSILVPNRSNERFNSGIFSTVQGKGKSEGIDITTNNLSLREGGVVSATTSEEGNAGKITINAAGTISAEGENPDRFSSGIFSAVQGTGNSGGIDITTNNLYLRGGGNVNASTSGVGKAGQITINASDTILAEGKNSGGDNSGIFSTVEETAIGNSVGIELTTANLSLKNEAEISAQSFGGGNAGNLSIQANSLTLSNGSSLSASTPVDTGGSITLDIVEVLTLRDDSFISAEALGEANGGEININAGFVLAFPSQNEGNDIIASASQGQGGNINITAQGIFGLEEGRATDNDGNRLKNGTNDLDASSQLGTDGIITINELEANPAEGIEDIPRFVIDPDKLVIFSLCSLARDSEFYYTAKGGNAPNLAEVREEGVIAVDLVEPVTLEEVEEQGSSPKGLAGASANASGAGGAEEEIVEAQGWILNENGVVELVAYKTHPNGVPVQPKDPRVCPKQEM